MKNLKTFETYIDNYEEDNGLFSSSREERFKTSIYQSYVNWEKQNYFKNVTEEEFRNRVYPVALKRKTTELDTNYRHRIADEKVTWYGEYGRVIGEVWIARDMKSYWINVNLV